jgi:hypothetical protein
LEGANIILHSIDYVIFDTNPSIPTIWL